MDYFVTGGTGFIGRHLIELLLGRGGRVYTLVREASLPRLEALRERWGEAAERIVPVVGDLLEPLLGVEPDVLASLRGSIAHGFHVGALYDMTADEKSLEAANVFSPRELDRRRRPHSGRLPRGHVRGGDRLRRSLLPRLVGVARIRTFNARHQSILHT